MNLLRRALALLPARPSLTPEDLEGFAASQSLAYGCAKSIAGER